MTNPSRCDIIIMSRGERPYAIKTKEKERRKMIITNNASPKKNKMLFDDIEDGEVFIQDDTLFLKIECAVVDRDYPDNEYNAVVLANGSMVHFESSEEVGKFIEQPEVIYNSDEVRYYKR